MNYYRLKELVYRTDTLKWCWAAGAMLHARAQLIRGRDFDAAKLLLRLDKHLGQQVFARARQPALKRIVDTHCRPSGRLGTLAGNSMLHLFAQSAEANAIRRRYASYGQANQVRLRLPRGDQDPERQGDLIVLKSHDPGSGERGVVLIKFNQAILACAAVFQLVELAKRYVLVVAPQGSWTVV